MVLIYWTELAVDDLKSIANYISRDSKKYAKIQVVRLRTRVNILKNNPYAGKIIPELKNDKFRELIEGNYRIIYKIVNELQIDILTIHHSARDLTKRPLE